MPFAINDTDVIVGWYTDSSGDDHGFVKTGNTFSSIDYPGAVEPFGTTITGINNSGTMVGCYWDGSMLHGFLYNAGSFTALNYPGAIESQPFGINNNGDVIGYYWDGTATHGFLYSEGTFNSFDIPAVIATQPYKINDNRQIIGGYNGNGNGFLYEGGVYTNLSFPGALYTAAYGINNSGQIVGSFLGPYPGNSGGVGFLYQGGNFVTVNFPASGGTSAYGINNLGEIVGSFYRGPPTASVVPFTYTTNNGTIAITGYIGPIGYVGAATIPATINGLPVTSIGSGAFTNNTTLTSVTIPNSVTNIGSFAFSGCASLNGVYFNGNAPGVGLSVFNSDTNVTVYYPAGTTGWGTTFGGLPAMLGSALVPAAYVVTNGTINITHYTGSGGAVIIPATISGLRVTGIGNDAFSGCTGLTSVTIPGSVTGIGNDAFSGCTGLTSVTIPNSVTNIGSFAFSGCASLNGVCFNGNAPSVGLSAFNSDPDATVYYLPGTTGWGSTFAGLPALLWNAQVQSSGGSFGVGTNGFGFNITGTSNLVIVVEAAKNLAQPFWLPVGTITLTSGSSYFSDPAWTNYPRRFYRLRAP
jgi:probable HAF family extracellular repeat protein